MSPINILEVLSFSKGKTYWITLMIKTLVSMQLLMMHMDGFWWFEKRKTDWKMETKTAQFLTNSWRQQQRSHHMLHNQNSLKYVWE